MPFRMALLSGEVETPRTAAPPSGSRCRSGWLCYPGKLKRLRRYDPDAAVSAGSGWLCYPGKLKPGQPVCLLIHRALVPDGFAIRGS